MVVFKIVGVFVNFKVCFISGIIIGVFFNCLYGYINCFLVFWFSELFFVDW